MVRPPWAGRDGDLRISIPASDPYELSPVRLPPWRCGTPRGHWGECSPFDNFSGKVPQLALQITGELEGSAATGPHCEAGGADLQVESAGPGELDEVTTECRFALERREWALYVSLAAGYPEAWGLAERWEESCSLCQAERPGAPPVLWSRDREICPAHRLDIWLISGKEVPDPVAVDTDPEPGTLLVEKQQQVLW